MREIQYDLNDFFESKILSYNFDILKNTLTFKLEIADNNNKTKINKLIFEGVTTFFFVNDNNEDRKKLYPVEENDYLELTGIYYIKNKISIIPSDSKEKWLNNYMGEGDIIIEIWGKLLIIEAISVRSDGWSHNL